MIRQKLYIFQVSVLLLFSFATLAAQHVTGLKTWHKDGQTFLYWNNIPAGKVQYMIYRAETPFRSVGDLSSENLVGTASDSSSYNRRLSKILGKPVFFRIDSAHIPMSAKKGLFVHTTVEKGNYYYAVMVSAGNKTNKRLFPGQNVLMQPVYETPDNPAAIWQTSLERNGFNHEVYVHWTASIGTSSYPALSNINSQPFNFSVIKFGESSSAPLILSLHQFGENFLSTKRFPKSANQIVLCPDDYMPNGALNSFWYGYHEKYHLTGNYNVPQGGVVADYTVRRINLYIDWALDKFNSDRNRVYLYGGSMGGSGSVFLAIALPSKIAACYAVVPKFDYSFKDDPNPESIYNRNTQRRQLLDKLWGTTEANLQSSDGIGIYDRMNAGLLARLFEEVSLPYIIAFNGKNDNVVGWAEKIPFYNHFQEGRHAGVFYWDDRNHGTAGTRHWRNMESAEYIFRFRLNRSFPAFSFCSANSNPGNGSPTDGDVFGAINGFLDWSDNITDEQDIYEINIMQRTVTANDSLINPPDRIFVDVTPRRLQRFNISASTRYKWYNIDANDRIIQSGIIRADKRCLLTVRKFLVTHGKGNRLRIESFSRKSG